jgi:hypothetical protein
MKIDTKPIHYFSYSQIANQGFTFALLDGDRYLHTPFMCKDYLQDIFWSEHTGKEGSVCGLVWKPGMIAKDAPRYRFGLHGGKVELAPHAPYLQQFLNTFEESLKFNRTEVMTTDDPHLIVVDFPRAWTESGPMISAYTTLIRVAGAYKGGDIKEYMATINKPLLEPGTYKQLWKPEPGYMAVEIQRLNVNFPRIMALLAGKMPHTTHAEVSTMSLAHYQGIMSFPKFPTV